MNSYEVKTLLGNEVRTITFNSENQRELMKRILSCLKRKEVVSINQIITTRKRIRI